MSVASSRQTLRQSSSHKRWLGSETKGRAHWLLDALQIQQLLIQESLSWTTAGAAAPSWKNQARIAKLHGQHLILKEPSEHICAHFLGLCCVRVAEKTKIVHTIGDTNTAGLQTLIERAPLSLVLFHAHQNPYEVSVVPQMNEVVVLGVCDVSFVDPAESHREEDRVSRIGSRSFGLKMRSIAKLLVHNNAATPTFICM